MAEHEKGPEGAPVEIQDTTVGDRDVNVRALVRFLGILTIATAVAAGLMWLLSVHFKRELVASDPVRPPLAEAAPRALPGPRLQTDPNKDMAAYRSEEEATLTSYAWRNREQGVARIPVARAIDILAEKGPPAPPPPPAPEAPPAPPKGAAR